MTRRVALTALVLCLLPSTFARAGGTDPTVCPILMTMAPTVDSLPSSPWHWYIDPATGDTWVEGQPTQGGGPLAASRPRHWEVTADVLTLTTRDDAGAPLAISRWKRSP